jgi:hypothetical protein
LPSRSWFAIGFPSFRATAGFWHLQPASPISVFRIHGLAIDDGD